MSLDFEIFGRKLLDETVADLKGEYDEIPDSVKKVLPNAAVLIAKGALEGSLSEPEQADLRQAVAIMANVKIGGRIALEQLLLEKATNLFAIGVSFVRKLIGV